MNVEEVLTRADVIWHDDYLRQTRFVWSRNQEAPLTKEEQETIRRMWAIRLNPIGWKVEFI